MGRGKESILNLMSSGVLIIFASVGTYIDLLAGLMGCYCSHQALRRGAHCPNTGDTPGAPVKLYWCRPTV